MRIELAFQSKRVAGLIGRPAAGCNGLGRGAVGAGDRGAENEPVFSAASLWEVAVKSGLGRADFQADPHLLRRGLLLNGYSERAISGAHAAAVAQLPPIHKDPFDRLLIAQAAAEGMLLLTADAMVALYPGPIRKV